MYNIPIEVIDMDEWVIWSKSRVVGPTKNNRHNWSLRIFCQGIFAMLVIPETFKHLNVSNGYLEAPEKLLGDIVVANWILKSEVKVKLSKIVFFAARLAKNLL